MSIVGGFDVHRKQITFDYLDTVTGEVKCGQIVAADRRRLAEWLQRFAGCDDVAFAVAVRDRGTAACRGGRASGRPG
jgi:transposase